MPEMKTRILPWVNTDTFEEMYGIQIKSNGKWRHAISNNEFLVFETKAEAKAAQAEIDARIKERGNG